MEKITKKDLVYWIFILVLILIIILTVKLGGNTNVVDSMGFAGTITSMILAVVAIIYSFVQSNSFENTTRKLDISASKIEEVTNKLDGVSEIEKIANQINGVAGEIDKKVFHLQNVITDLGEGMNQISVSIENNLGDLQRFFDDNMIDIHNSVEATRADIINKLSEGSIKNNDKNSYLLKDKEIIREIIGAMGKTDFLAIYYILLLNKKGLSGDMQGFSMWLLENNLSVWSERYHEDKNRVNEYQCFTFGFVINTVHNYSKESYEWYGVSGNLTNFKVSNVSDIFIEVVDGYVQYFKSLSGDDLPEVAHGVNSLEDYVGD